MFAIATIDKKAVKKIGDAAKYYKQHFNEKNLLVIPNNSLSEEDKAVRTIIEQATGKKAEEMSPQLFEQLFEQVKELYQENIVNQAKPQHKSEPAPKTAEPKEEPTEHSLTAEKDSYEIDL